MCLKHLDEAPQTAHPETQPEESIDIGGEGVDRI